MQTKSTELADGLRGILDGLMPVILVAMVFLAGVVLTTVARLVTTPQGFDLEQSVGVAVLAATIVIAAVTYTIACFRALGRVRALASEGSRSRAVGMLWGLGLTVLVVLLPIVVAALSPQHPAP
jgi:hypothetical protein